MGIFLGRPGGDKRRLQRGARRSAFTCPPFLRPLIKPHLSLRKEAHDSPSTPDEAGGGAAPGSGLSVSPCCTRCRCRELSAPSAAVVAPLAAAAAAPAAVSGMLSIREQRRKMKLFSGIQRCRVASQGDLEAWV